MKSKINKKYYCEYQSLDWDPKGNKRLYRAIKHSVRGAYKKLLRKELSQI